MGEKKRQKFSLSDIIRKLNEAEEPNRQASSKPSARPEGSAESPSAHRDNTAPFFPFKSQPMTPEPVPDIPPTAYASSPPTAISVSDGAAAVQAQPLPQHANQPSAIPDFSAAPQKQPEDAESDEFDIMRYVGIILRRKNIVIASLIVGIFFSVNTYVKAVRFYTAHARMLFSPGYQDIMGNNQGMFLAWGSREEKLNTHLELLKSQTVLTRVTENIGKRLLPGALAAGIKVMRSGTEGEKTDIIDIAYSHTNAEIARDIVNELCKTYTEYIKEVNVQDITRLIVKLEDQISKVEKDLDTKENLLRIFKERNRTVELSSETNLTIAKLSQIETARQQTQLDMLESREKFLGLKKEIDQQEVDVIQSMTYQNPYQNHLADLELQLNSLSAENSPEHYKVRMVKAEIDKIKDAMKSDIIKEASSKTFIKNPIRESLLKDLISITIEKSALEAKRNAQEQLARQLDADLQKLPSMELQYAQLTRETESLLQVMKLLKSRYEEAKIKRDSQDSDLKILEWAQLPTMAISNVKLSKIFITILIGLIIGIALAFLLEYLDQSIKEPHDIERSLELPLLGIVPTIETEKAIIEFSRDKGKTVLEPFRALRANLKHIAEQRNIKTLIVSSAVKGEGKTTLAANLAITFAMDGKKVILVDGDLRRAQMHGLFHLPKNNGLCDYLLGASEADDIIKPTVHQNLFVITAGEHPQNPGELVGSFRFSALVKELRARADIIIFDSPALLPVSDVLSMAPKMDACIMVVRAAWTPLKAAQQAKLQLTRIGCTIIGAILNGISHSRGYYPYYYGYYRYYAYKYTYEEDQHSKATLRRFGLAVETKFKEHVQTILHSLPHWIAATRDFLGSLFKRKTFWILLSVAIALVVTEMTVKRLGFTPAPKQAITYIGASPHAKKTDSDSALQASNLNDASAPKPSDSGLSIKHAGGLQAFNQMHNTLSDTLDKPQNPMINTPIADSLQNWRNAFNRGDLRSFLSFYDSVRFKFPGGDFQSWKTAVANGFSLQKHARLSIDSMWVDTTAPLFAKVTIFISIASASKIDTLCYGMMWQKSSESWRIIREKQRRFK